MNYSADIAPIRINAPVFIYRAIVCSKFSHFHGLGAKLFVSDSRRRASVVAQLPSSLIREGHCAPTPWTEIMCFPDKAFYSHTTIGVASSCKIETDEALCTVYIPIGPPCCRNIYHVYISVDNQCFYFYLFFYIGMLVICRPLILVPLICPIASWG